MPNDDNVILLVEDDRVDIMTVQRALKKINVSIIHSMWHVPVSRHSRCCVVTGLPQSNPCHR